MCLGLTIVTASIFLYFLPISVLGLADTEKESLAAEHAGELLGDTLPELLDGGRVTDEDGGHLETLGGDVADGGLDVVGDPLDEVRGVLVLDVEHLLVNLLGRHAATEESRASEVT